MKAVTVPGASTAGHPAAAFPDTRWRTRDIVIGAIIGVAFGVVFWAWGLAWSGFDPLFALVPPAKNLLYAVWLVPAVLAPLIIRKPGAALFAEMVAAAVSTLIGSQWGPDTLLSGFVQGAAAEPSWHGADRREGQSLTDPAPSTARTTQTRGIRPVRAA